MQFDCIKQTDEVSLQESVINYVVQIIRLIHVYFEYNSIVKYIVE